MKYIATSTALAQASPTNLRTANERFRLVQAYLEHRTELYAETSLRTMLDVSDLKGFYDLHIGQIARRLIRKRIRELWPSVRGQSVLGLGYATPYLRPLQAEAERVLALMPAQQGVIAWPQEAGGLTALVDETELPLADGVPFIEAYVMTSPT